MRPELAVPASFLLAALLTYALTPITARVAHRTSFLDVPSGYKAHLGPTPYLGGTAIIIGFIVAALIFAGGTGTNALILGCAVVVWVLGTIDDRIPLPLAPRLLIEVAVAALLWSSGHGWTVGWAPGGLALTIVWVVGVMNAFNLMDNMDGATGVTAAVSAAGAGALALVFDHTVLAALCFSTAGACAGFLPHNLARPTRSFMGDGGSLPAGFLVASVAMSAGGGNWPGLEGVVIAALLVGLVILDTALVTFSRLRGGRPVLIGGRDHLTHRLLKPLGSVQRVAFILGLAQLALCGVTVAVATTNVRWIIIVGWVFASLGVLIIWALDSRPWFERSEEDPALLRARAVAPRMKHLRWASRSASPSSAQTERATRS
jgi:UDP-GlcNAc:undecaprenyl-phosphate GlcNAc-1-phosphate transferase